MKILILNASPSSKSGNCQILIQRTIGLLNKFPQLDSSKVVQLVDVRWTAKNKKKIFSEITSADGFIFVTGTYWDSWGSPLQIFLENVTELEGTNAFLGKPAAVFVLNHSVGGKSVLSRLQGVLSTLGCLIPPMSGFVYSWVSQELLKTKTSLPAAKDLWQLQDLSPILENLIIACQNKIVWNNWPVDRKDYRKQWLK